MFCSCSELDSLVYSTHVQIHKHAHRLELEDLGVVRPGDPCSGLAGSAETTACSAVCAACPVFHLSPRCRLQEVVQVAVVAVGFCA